MNPREQYLERVKSLLIELSSILGEDERLEVMHLVDHDEPAEGLVTLAWIIHNKHKVVSSKIVQEIYSLTDGIVLREHFPPGFEDYGT